MPQEQNRIVFFASVLGAFSMKAEISFAGLALSTGVSMIRRSKFSMAFDELTLSQELALLLRRLLLVQARASCLVFPVL
jgi:hypothetical protein